MQWLECQTVSRDERGSSGAVVRAPDSVERTRVPVAQWLERQTQSRGPVVQWLERQTQSRGPGFQWRSG